MSADVTELIEATTVPSQHRAYRSFLAQHGLEDRWTGSGVPRILTQLAELERLEVRTMEKLRLAASGLDTRRLEGRLARIEQQVQTLNERLGEYHPDHVEEMFARFNAGRNGGSL